MFNIFNVSVLFSTRTGKFFSKLLSTNWCFHFNRSIHVSCFMSYFSCLECIFEGLKSIFWLTSNCLFSHFVRTGNQKQKTFAILICSNIFTHNKFMNSNRRLFWNEAKKLIFWFHVKIYCDHLFNISYYRLNGTLFILLIIYKYTSIVFPLQKLGKWTYKNMQKHSRIGTVSWNVKWQCEHVYILSLDNG